MPEFENLEPYESRERSGRSRITPVAPHTLPASDYVPQSDPGRRSRRKDAQSLQPAPIKITPLDSRDMERAFRKADRAERAERRRRKGSLLQRLLARLRAFFGSKAPSPKKPAPSSPRSQRNYNTSRKRTNAGPPSHRQNRDQGGRRNRPAGGAENEDSHGPRKPRKRRSNRSNEGQAPRQKPARDPSEQPRKEGARASHSRGNPRQNRPSKGAPTPNAGANTPPTQGDGQGPKRRRNRNRRNRGGSGDQGGPGPNNSGPDTRAPQS